MADSLQPAPAAGAGPAEEIEQFDAIVIAGFAPERLGAKHAFERRDRLVNILHGDSDVI